MCTAFISVLVLYLYMNDCMVKYGGQSFSIRAGFHKVTRFVLKEHVTLDRTSWFIQSV